jgi:hypothetical protein
MSSSRVIAAAIALVALQGSVQAADNLPGDVQAYVNRRTGCNYWPSETAKSKLRKAEIEHNVRALNCPTLDHEEATLRARYQGKPELLQAIADAHDAMPD